MFFKCRGSLRKRNIDRLNVTFYEFIFYRETVIKQFTVFHTNDIYRRKRRCKLTGPRQVRESSSARSHWPSHSTHTEPLAYSRISLQGKKRKKWNERETYSDMPARDVIWQSRNVTSIVKIQLDREKYGFERQIQKTLFVNQHKQNL